jgi:hypothetical protein
MWMSFRATGCVKFFLIAFVIMTILAFAGR